MGNHPFNVVVVLFWFATMGWLVTAKILPPLLIGDPPKYSVILKEDQQQAPVCWSVSLNDRVIGWAATKAVPRNDGITNLYSRVYLGELPLEELTPPWLSSVFKSALPNINQLDLDKRSRVTIDPLGRLVSFDSRLRVAEVDDAIRVAGEVDGTFLKMSMQSDGKAHPKIEHYLPQDGLIVDEFSPQAWMPGLRVGQAWTVPLYSPFRPANSPMEVLQARVGQEASLTWDGKRCKCRVIIYENDAGSGLNKNETRGRVWVREDGLVLRQEVSIFKSRLHFIRVPDRPAENIWNTLGEDWTEPLPRVAARRVLRDLAAIEP